MTSPICLGMLHLPSHGGSEQGFRPAASCPARSLRLLRGLDEMEVGRPPGPETRVDPLAHHLGIRDDLVGEPEERNIGELLEEVVGDRPSQTVPLLGIYGLDQGVVGFVDELVLVVVVLALAPVADPDTLLPWPARDDVEPDAALAGLVAE